MSLWACLFRSASTTSQTRRPYLRVHCPIFGLFVTTFSAHSLSSMVSALLSSWRDVITTSISGNWNSERSPPPCRRLLFLPPKLISRSALHIQTPFWSKKVPQGTAKVEGETRMLSTFYFAVEPCLFLPGNPPSRMSFHFDAAAATQTAIVPCCQLFDPLSMADLVHFIESSSI